MQSEITRRDAAWLVARAFATAAGASFLSRWAFAAQAAHSEHSHAPADPHDWNAYKPQFFSPEEFQSLAAFTEILIPSDETPGAREAHVAAFIDFVVNAAAEYAPQVQTEWREAVKSLASRNFATLSPEAQNALVQQMSEAPHDDDRHETYQLIRHMTIYAFYTSRVGLVDVLEYKGLAYLTEFPACTHPEHQKA